MAVVRIATGPGPQPTHRADGGAVAIAAAAVLAVTVAGAAFALPVLSASRAAEPVAAEHVVAEPVAAAPVAAEPSTSAVVPGTGTPATAVPAPADAPAPLDLGPCLRTDVPDVVTAQADLDAGCTVELTYGPGRWLAAHDHDAGDGWKAMPDGAEFAYAGHTYRVVDRTRTPYVTGPVALGPLVHGDLTLQTCDGVDELVFLHAALVE